MLNRLPEFIDPLLLVAKCQGFEGTIAIGKMKRLAASLTDTAGEAQVVIQFGRDSAGLAIATGKVTAVLRLQCQRCLDPVEYSVNSEFVLGVVASLEQARTLPEDYEPLIADQGHVSLTELVEDEILLALPAIAMHTHECAATRVRDSEYNAGPRDTAAVADKQNPFAVLAELKEKITK